MLTRTICPLVRRMATGVWISGSADRGLRIVETLSCDLATVRFGGVLVLGIALRIENTADSWSLACSVSLEFRSCWAKSKAVRERKGTRWSFLFAFQSCCQKPHLEPIYAELIE